MRGHIVIPIVLTVASLLVALFLLGQAELDEILARWRTDRDDRQSMAEWERIKRDAAPTFPRSVPR